MLLGAIEILLCIVELWALVLCAMELLCGMDEPCAVVLWTEELCTEREIGMMAVVEC